MPQNKNQHYVPRAHFKPFSMRQEGNSIHVYNVGSARAIGNAPLKGQCAKDYFYGKDLIVEKFLSQLEGNYAAIVQKLQVGLRSFSNQDLSFLRGFTLLQALRTEAAIRRYSAMTVSMKKAVFRQWSAQQADMSHDELVRSTMQIFLDTREYVDDLKSCILINGTYRGFITSDDPAFLSNRYHLQRLRQDTFGWSSSGALMFLPLTPRHMLMCYDGLVYTVPSRRSDVVEITRSDDVDTLNEFQALNGHQNLYFADWDDCEAVRARYRAASSRRMEPRHRLRVLIQTHADDRGEYYRLATEEEQEGGGPFILQSSIVFPIPRRWPSCLRFREPARTYSNGSAMGYVRRPEWLRSARS